MSRVTKSVFGVALVPVVCLLLLGGCAREPELSERAARGKFIFEARGCSKCHKVFGKGGKKGPPLTGRENQSRDRQWYVEFLNDPRSKIPNGKMPKPLVTAEEIGFLTDYMVEIR